MKSNDRLISVMLKRIATEVSWYGNLLYNSACPYEKAVILNKLRFNMQELILLSDSISNENERAIFLRQDQTFTSEELARFTGLNGNPAYIAVQGVVYDVTNNAAWAAATHFGLTAGRDLTIQFASCHPGQPILNDLIVVGRLV